MKALSLLFVAGGVVGMIAQPTTLPDFMQQAGDLQHGSVAASELEHGDFHCCAMWRDGSYYSNISVSGILPELGDTKERVYGYMAADAGKDRFAVSIGSQDIRNSQMGFYASKCAKKDKAFAVAWDPEGCHVYNLPKGVPKMCFGKDSYYPIFHSKVRLDFLTHLLKFESECGNHNININPLTCMPYWHSNYITRDSAMFEVGDATGRDESETANAPHLRGEGSNVDSAKKHNIEHMIVMHENATATAPHHDVFGFPTRCATLAETMEQCDF